MPRTVILACLLAGCAPSFVVRKPPPPPPEKERAPGTPRLPTPPEKEPPKRANTGSSRADAR